MDSYNIVFEPDGKSLEIRAGATVFEAALRAGIIINASCGGRGTCGKCKVTLGHDGSEVLACQCKVHRDLKISIPEASRFFDQKILQHGVERDITISPMIRKKLIEIKSAHPAGLLENLQDPSLEFTDQALADLKSFEAALPATATAVLFGDKVVAVEAGNTCLEIYGVAVDIGTTTVVAKLLDLIDGRVLDTAATGNPQRAFGDDVISRISYGETEEGLAQEQKVIIECINKLIDQLCRSSNVSASRIYELAAAGNTTMSHIFLALPVKQLGQAPYHAYSVDAYDKPIEQMGIKIARGGNVHTIENIAGFVGSDTVACAVAVAMDQQTEMTLCVDIGTNGEIILGTKDKMYSASCAAGPAFEGARIGQGSRAVDGAIEKVSIKNGDIEIETIGSKPPCTICGSGLIDAVAVIVDQGIVDYTGRFVSPDDLKGKIPDALASRVVDIGNHQFGFILAHQKHGMDKPVILTQRDIRESQLSKAAIRAGIKLLMKKFGIEDDGISQILLAGAFGNYIRRESARRIGLLPNLPLERIHFVGNAASSGAQMVLLSSDCRKLAGHLAREINYIEIAHELEFQTTFADCMMFE
ncbi:MAG: hypothetical protein A2Y07_00655 [Planctomycetes bacterium GWF2_50_10]|nr:MAG: hypothetical protein A2Y07_00655 [Planctomycetes bacterium GWF2_50_10]